MLVDALPPGQDVVERLELERTLDQRVEVEALSMARVTANLVGIVPHRLKPRLDLVEFTGLARCPRLILCALDQKEDQERIRRQTFVFSTSVANVELVVSKVAEELASCSAKRDQTQ